SLVKAGFDTLVEAGYQPELAYFEVLHELKLIVDLMYEGGLSGMRYSVSDTVEWCAYVSGDIVINDGTKERMKQILADIQSGKFAKEWIAENENGRPKFNAKFDEDKNSQLEKVGRELRKMMPFVKSEGNLPEEETN